jgi:fatty acid desaturase
MQSDAKAFGRVDHETLKWLSRRSDARGLLQLTAHLIVLLVTGFGVWASRGSVWLLPALSAHGVTLSFLFCPLHESIHRTAFASRWLNDAVAWSCGALLILPPVYFRQFHFAHHRFTQDPARDPELIEAPPASLASYAWRMTGLPNWYSRISVTLRHALTGRVSEAYVPVHMRAIVVREARILWGCYACLLAVSLFYARADALFYWILPALVGQPALRLLLLAEHSGCELTDNMLSNTRTTYTNSLVRFLAWQMPYHAEHHALPSVPFYALARVNTWVREGLAVTAPGYRSVHRDLIRKLRYAAAAAGGHAHDTSAGR